MVIACGLTVSVNLVHGSDSQSINGFCLVSGPGKNHFLYLYIQYVTLKRLRLLQMIANLRAFHSVITNNA